MSAGTESHLCIPTGLSLGTTLTFHWLAPPFDWSEVVLGAAELKINCDFYKALTASSVVIPGSSLVGHKNKEQLFRSSWIPGQLQQDVLKKLTLSPFPQGPRPPGSPPLTSEEKQILNPASAC